MENIRKSGKKRLRSANFTPDETRTLIELVAANLKIIENKSNDAFIWEEKERAWKQIEVSFNGLGGSAKVYRNSRLLRVKYEVLKSELRRKMRKANDGDGPVLSPVEQKIKEIISFCAADPDNSNTCAVFNPYFVDEYKVELNIEDEPPEKKICMTPKDEPIQLSESDSSDSDTDSDTVEHQPSKERKEYSSSEVRAKDDFSKQKEKSSFEKLTDEKIYIAQLQKQLIQEELEHKAIQKKMLIEEIEQKRTIYDLEKQQLLLKIELLNMELQRNKSL